MAATLISASQLSRFAPKCRADELAPHLDAAAKHFSIDTPREIRHWMAALHHESMGFTRLSENLNYSAQRMAEVWPGRYAINPRAKPRSPNALAKSLERNPEKLANNVYGDRLGNVVPGDGYRYRGGGLIMLTGRTNYALGSRWSGLDLLGNPDLVRTPAGAATTAGGFWHANGLNGIVAADPGERICTIMADHLRINEEDDVVEARRKVNGGLIGLDDVRAQLARAAAVWGL